MDVGDDRDSHLVRTSGTRVTVSLVRHRSRHRLVAIVLALGRRRAGVAAAGPRERPLEPARGRSAQRISATRRSSAARGTRARSSRSAWPASALELGALAVVVRRHPARAARGGSRRPVAGGAAAGAGLASPVAAAAAAGGRRPPARDRGRADHAVVARMGGRPGQGPDDLGDDARPARGRGGGRRHPPLSAGLVAAGGRGLGRGRGRARGARPGRARPRVQRLHAAARGRDAARRARARLRRRASSVGEVYSVDASRRTTAANAYVTGLGPTKRVVLFDTLLDRYSRDEIRVVVAHELAHVRNRDVRARRRVRGDRRPGRGARGSATELGAVGRARHRRRRCPRSASPRR